MLLLHAGMPKSGSTSLQAALAAEACLGDGTGYFGPTPDANHLSDLDLRTGSVSRFQRDVRGPRSPAAVRRSFLRMRWDGRPPTSFKHLIVSEEMLAHASGDGHTGRPLLWRNIDRVLEASGQQASDAVVLLSLRDAASTLPSLYAESRRHLAGRFPTVDDFITAFLAGRLPAYEERFRPETLLASARVRGLRLELISLVDAPPTAVGRGALLDGVFPWQGRHELQRLNTRRDDAGWHSDPVTAFNRLETKARRLPIRRPADPVYRRLRRTLGRITIAPGAIVRPDPQLIAEVRRRYPPLDVHDGMVQ